MPREPTYKALRNLQTPTYKPPPTPPLTTMCASAGSHLLEQYVDNLRLQHIFAQQQPQEARGRLEGAAESHAQHQEQHVGIAQQHVQLSQERAHGWPVAIRAQLRLHCAVHGCLAAVLFVELPHAVQRRHATSSRFSCSNLALVAITLVQTGYKHVVKRRNVKRIINMKVAVVGHLRVLQLLLLVQPRGQRGRRRRPGARLEARRVGRDLVVVAIGVVRVVRVVARRVDLVVVQVHGDEQHREAAAELERGREAEEEHGHEHREHHGDRVRVDARNVVEELEDRAHAEAADAVHSDDRDRPAVVAREEAVRSDRRRLEEQPRAVEEHAVAVQLRVLPQERARALALERPLGEHARARRNRDRHEHEQDAEHSVLRGRAVGGGGGVVGLGGLGLGVLQVLLQVVRLARDDAEQQQRDRDLADLAQRALEHEAEEHGGREDLEIPEHGQRRRVHEAQDDVREVVVDHVEEGWHRVVERFAQRQVRRHALARRHDSQHAERELEHLDEERDRDADVRHLPVLLGRVDAEVAGAEQRGRHEHPGDRARDLHVRYAASAAGELESTPDARRPHVRAIECKSASVTAKRAGLFWQIVAFTPGGTVSLD
ncbi:hypothetical protein PybrP1_010337 [[Pythium] brassicae (nom. inval.)]|nr:hypothetical protein PybrP1_010337 [[Pythium] brassicae (nom. inval.)]